MESIIQWVIALGAVGCIGLIGCGGAADDEITAQHQAALETENRSEDNSHIGSVSGRSAQQLHPIVNCVAPSANNQLVAHFGYDNPQGATLTIPVGLRNAFVPPPFNRGQATTFVTGENNNVLSVVFNPHQGPIAWKLGKALAVAWENSPPCVPSFAGAASATLVSDSEIALTWAAATDYTTPSSGIVYDICESMTSGSCATNFVVAQTTEPGAI